jgi:AP endonuclease-2
MLANNQHFCTDSKLCTGYSGVAIYTRQAVCAPIRFEEGITGFLQTPGPHPAKYRSLPPGQGIGGHLTNEQLDAADIDSEPHAVELDSDGRCVILEFPAFVLIGVLCPPSGKGRRKNFRLMFLQALVDRIRNLHKLGKKVVLAANLKLALENLDIAGIPDPDYYTLESNRRVFNQLVVDGGRRVITGEQDHHQSHEAPVLLDLCRLFHPDRRGMFTCWSKNTRHRTIDRGYRIDYIFASISMRSWFTSANTQEAVFVSIT